MKQLIQDSTTVFKQGYAQVQAVCAQILLPFAMGCGSGFLLSACRITGRALPMGVGFTAALGLSAAGIGAAVGSSVGYALLWGMEAALPPMSVIFLLLVGAAIFHNTTLADQRWFMPLLAGGLMFVVELVTVSGLAQPLRTVFLLLRPLTAAGGCILFRQGQERKRTGVIFGAGCLICGLASVLPQLPLNLGAAAAFGMVIACAQQEWGLLLAAAAGIGLDCAGVMAMPMTAALCLCQQGFRLLPGRNDAVIRWIGATVCAVFGVVFWLVFPKVLPLSACIGCGVGLCLPAKAPPAKAAKPYARLRRRLEQLGAALTQMEQAVTANPTDSSSVEPAQLYDRAADRVCKCCVRFRTCWTDEAEDTYRALSLAATPILSRGRAVAEDFPAEFCQRCRHAERFAAAINQELDQLRCRQQYFARTCEQQRLLAQELAVLARIIHRSAQAQAPAPSPRFRMELGCGSACRREGEVNGDQWTCVRISPSRVCILLCDGMGTGEEAARESRTALELLSALLKAGADGDEALRVLNGLYVLRANGIFTAIDLLDMDLAVGHAVLYKWGGAAAYWKHHNLVKKFGLESPPPGIDLAAQPPERISLNLSHRQILVLTTDGVPAADAAERIRAYYGTNLDTLCGHLITDAQLRTHDDMTALAVRLYPLHSSL